ncbi:MAG TPA: molybdenum cofactor guanylyltransferase [Gaiellaceae bacterium]|nr:molybdenum cofactor guanylyltransferase [Gaiellaceae bacterium]
MADRVTGVLLVGGASARFGSSKALAVVDGETLAARAWRTLGDACDERMAVGKGDEELPFPVLADGVEERAAIHGLVAGLRAASTDVCVVMPVDMPNLTADALRALVAACRDAAVTQTGPLPGAYRKSALPALEAGELSIRRAIAGLDVAVVELDESLLVNVNTPHDVPI